VIPKSGDRFSDKITRKECVIPKSGNRFSDKITRKETVMPRLFTGLEIPPDVAQALSTLRGGLPGARWIDPENYHITLRFIGDVDDSTAHEVELLLGRIRREAFDLHFDGVISFGGSKPRAVVAAVPRVQALLDVQAEQERLMQRIGLEPEGRKFTPHVSLARLRDASSFDVADYLSGRGYFRTASFRVSQFVLFSSRNSVGGGPYVVEASYPLKV
jgi:2'-5' RNA ligase